MSKDIRFCPNCGSTNVEFDTDHTNVIGEIIANQNQWLCNECGYKGLMPEGNPEQLEEEGIEEKNEEKIEFDPVEQETVDTALGKGYFRFFIYISLPVMIVYVFLKLVFPGIF